MAVTKSYFHLRVKTMHMVDVGSNIIGLAGVFMVLIAYFFLQIEKMSADTITYSVLNLVGSIFILFSLCYHWNLSSFVIEIAWLAISLYGLVRSIYHRFNIQQ